jgi:MerR family transcriptional regulator, light-induced transcriptional regulator
MNNTGYSIKDLEVLSGIKAHTIRIWEKRYNLLEPNRTDTNIRFYTDGDLRRMLNVSLLVKHGFKISKVAEWDNEKLKNTILDVTRIKTSDSDYIDRLLLSMVNFDYRGFIQLTNEIIQKMGIEEAVDKVFFTLFVRIGTFWQVGSIFPAQEHFVTHIIRQKLIVEIDRLENIHKKEATILFYLSENELHELSLLYYTFLALKNSYHVIYLGQTVPFADLQKLNTQVKIDYVFTAFVNSILKEDLEKYLADVKDLFDKQKIFITGGQIQNHNPVLPRNVKVVKDFKDFKKYLGVN